VRATFAALCCGLTLLGIATAAVAAPGATNASWNSGPDGKRDVGFGIYQKEGSCEDFKSALPIRIGMKNLKAGASSGPVQVKDLNFCLLFVSESAAPPDYGTSSCASGSVEFSYDAATNEYHGRYDLTMKNKAVRRGEFRAQLCKPAEPVKK
jgi:hypothetical protein